MDDARVAQDAAGIDQVTLIGDTEGGPMALTYAASHPDRVSGLVLVNSFARWRRADDYPIGMPDATWERLVERYEQHWGATAEILDLTAPSYASDPRFRAWFTRYQRLAMPPGAASMMYRWVTSLDVRSVLPAIRVPTLIVHRSANRHHRVEFGRYLAGHIRNARYEELPGGDSFPLQAGDFSPILDHVEEFVTGSRAERVLDRMLATILFTDIVGSTTMAVSRGDAAWLELRRRHDEIVRAHIERFRGRELSHTGDGFVATFDGPARAVTCAARLREALGELGIQIRAGLHTGEVELTSEPPGGVALHIAARVMAEANGGAIMTSGTVRDLVAGTGIEFAARGERDLKGVPGRWPIFEAVEAP